MAFLDTNGLQRLWSHIQAGFNDLQSQINNLTITGDYVPLTRKINNKELSEDITLSAADVGAAKNELTVSLIADGTTIVANSDLNTIEFLAVGNYKCFSNSTAETLTNCPTTLGFRMEVFVTQSGAVGDEATTTWRYRIRKITDVAGKEYIQAVHSESEAGTFIYGDWQRILTSGSHLITDARNYGDRLPDTGVEGQIFFKKVT